MSTLAPARPFVRRPGEAERIWITGDTMDLLVTSADTGGALTVIENVGPPGSGPPPHLHEREDEVFYVLAGEFDLRLGDEVVRGGPGTVVFVPHGTVHNFRTVGPEPGRLLIAFAPGGLDGFFRESGRPARGDGPAPAVDADEIARTAEAGARHGLRVVAW